MIPEIDIWRTAGLMIRQYGQDAGKHADERAGELIEKGDTAGGEVWQRICQVIEQLQNRTPDGPVH